MAVVVVSMFVGKPATRSRQQAARLFRTFAGVLEVKRDDFQSYWSSSIDSPNLRASSFRRSFARRQSSISHSISKIGDNTTKKNPQTIR